MRAVTSGLFVALFLALVGCAKGVSSEQLGPPGETENNDQETGDAAPGDPGTPSIPGAPGEDPEPNEPSNPGAAGAGAAGGGGTGGAPDEGDSGGNGGSGGTTASGGSSGGGTGGALAWTCDSTSYDEGFVTACDCGCSIPDPDCGFGGCETPGCYEPECAYCSDASGTEVSCMSLWTGCSDTCGYAYDGECDDGGPGSSYNDCDLGTDCNDCGPR